MKEYFLACGYPKTLIENGSKKAKSIPQQELRKTKPRTKEDIVTFVSTHNPNNPNMWPLISTTLGVLKSSQKNGKVATKHNSYK